MYSVCRVFDSSTVKELKTT